jgi:hypothetical protein
MSTGEEDITSETYWDTIDERIHQEEIYAWELQDYTHRLPVREITNLEFGIFHPFTQPSHTQCTLYLLKHCATSPTKDILSTFKLLTRDITVRNRQPDVYVLSQELKLQVLTTARKYIFNGNKFWYLKKQESIEHHQSSWSNQNTYFRLFHQFQLFTEEQKQNYFSNFAQNPEWIIVGNLPTEYERFPETASTYDPRQMNR